MSRRRYIVFVIVICKYMLLQHYFSYWDQIGDA